jgi:hypothetical protein
MATVIAITGNLVQDEVGLNYTSDVTAVVNFSVADDTWYYDEQATSGGRLARPPMEGLRRHAP